MLHIFLANRSGECRPGSCGKPVPGYEISIVDDRGVELPRGEIGNLQVSGDSIMLQYWNRPQETRKVICGQTMKTGDKYLCDRDGYFFFMGRQDDAFKVSGQWISPFEIEDVLLQHESVLDVAIVPESDGGYNLTHVVAYIALKSEYSESEQLKDSLRKYARTKLPHFKAPKVINFLDRLPRTPTGKIHRKSLLKAHQLVSNKCGICFTFNYKVAPGYIRHLDYGAITLADYAPKYKACGITDRMYRLASDFIRANFSIHLALYLLLARWQKLIFNIPFNGLSVVLDSTIDKLIDESHSRLLIEQIMQEVAAIAKANGRNICDLYIQERFDLFRPNEALSHEYETRLRTTKTSRN